MFCTVDIYVRIFLQTMMTRGIDRKIHIAFMILNYDITIYI